MSVLVLAASGGAIATVGFVAWQSWRNYQKYNSLRCLPSPSGHWLLGNTPQLLAAAKENKYFSILSDWAKEFGSMYVYWFAGRPTIVLSKPKVIEQILTRKQKNLTFVRSPQIRQLWKELFGGETVIQQDGQEWQWRRQTYNQSLRTSHLNAYLTIICQGCDRVVDTLKDAAKNEKVIKVDPIFAELTMKLISRFLLGIPLDKQSSSHEGPPLEPDRVYETFVILTKKFMARVAGEKKVFEYLPTKSANAYRSARQYLDEFIAPRVNLALQIAGRNPQLTTEKVSPEFENSMLVHLAKQSKFTEKMLRAEAKLMLFAGTDTTAHTLSFTVGALGLNLNVFEKARQEVDDVWHNYGEINSESIKKLTYLQGVIKESMRLYPVSNGSTGCVAQTDTFIEEVFIPKGTKIVWSILAAGRDADEYPNPNEFLPERWIKDKQKDRSPLTFLVFGSGPHRCLGESLAILEATVMLAMLLRYFDWETVNGLRSLEQLGQNLTVFPSDRMPVKFTVRKFTSQTANVK